MSRRAADKVPAAGVVEQRLCGDDLSIVLSALWVWKAQLGRVGSKQPVPGLASGEARKKVDEIARNLGGDPDAYFFGLQPSQRC